MIFAAEMLQYSFPWPYLSHYHLCSDDESLLISPLRSVLTSPIILLDTFRGKFQKFHQFTVLLCLKPIKSSSSTPGCISLPLPLFLFVFLPSFRDSCSALCFIVSYLGSQPVLTIWHVYSPILFTLHNLIQFILLS